ncbi:MAG TPA: FAD-binding oxidoreductase [Gammaproteobacteria bacterium]
MATLPPGVSAAEFETALGKFRAVVGEQWVFHSDEDVALYRDAYSPERDEPTERLASAAVAPSTVEQVQQIVRIANEHKIPLYPISTGKNLGYGGSAPILSGSVVVDLKRMNRIIAVDETRCSCIVEPGVSYFDLYRYIKERGLKLWIDCPDPGWGSLIGNALDHGVGYTYGFYRDHFGSHCGMEVVLPNGELMRTGMAALANDALWADYKYGFGPYVAGLFGQGNFGIVTKMGFWLMPEPEAYRTGIVSVPRRGDIIPLVHHVNHLENQGLIGMPAFRSPLGQARAREPELRALLETPGGPSDEALDRFAASKSIPSWAVELRFYGPEKTIAGSWEYAQARIGAAIPGARFQDGVLYRFPLTPEQEAQVHRVHRLVDIGVPNMAIFSIAGGRTEQNPDNADGGQFYFSPMIPRTGEALLDAGRKLGQAYREAGLPYNDLFPTPACWHPRAFIMITSLPVSRLNPEINRRSREAFRRLAQIAAENGWGEYRSPPFGVDLVMSAYSFNNHALRRFCETIKDAVDPNGIIAAGRGGIWPRHIREANA